MVHFLCSYTTAIVCTMLFCLDKFTEIYEVAATIVSELNNEHVGRVIHVRLN